MKKYLLAAGIFAATMSLSVAEPAAALTFDYDAETVTINTATDLNESFGIFFNGFVNNNLVAGLTSEALFTISSITSTALTFNVDITNTSSDPITSSRVSILGFDLDPNPSNVTSTGIFTKVTTGNPPGTVVGPVEFCFKQSNGGNCSGGGGFGVNQGELGTFSPTFTYAALPSTITLSNFFVRYQEIEGTSLGNSGVGVGEVPTPALLPGLVGMGVAALRKRGQCEEDQEA